MTWLNTAINSGAITWLALAVLTVEAMIYVLFFKRMARMLPTLAAGACLVLALRSALLRDEPELIATFLTLSFIFHVLEVWQWSKMSKNQQQ
jgi:hypothetical protein